MKLYIKSQITDLFLEDKGLQKQSPKTEICPYTSATVQWTSILQDTTI